MKWRFSNIALLLLILAPAAAGAEMVAGTTLSVDRQQGTFVMLTDAQAELEVLTNISPLPRRVAPGKRVRIWGRYEASGNRFIATDVRGPGKHHYHDPTGVRGRINKRQHCPDCPDGSTLDEKRDNRGYGGGNGGGS